MNIEELKQRAAAGDAEAQYELGICYLNGEDIKLDEEAAVLWFQISAKQGYAEAQSVLGECYHFGAGVEQNMEVAVKWYRLAAEQGLVEAQTKLGGIYLGVEGVEQNYEEAVKCYRLAAEQGNDKAQYNLGYAYANGDGVEPNYEEAVKWYRLAAEQGNDKAQYNLGYACQFGDGVEQNYEEAVKWYRLAAEQGHKYAKNKVLEVERRIEKEKKENARYSKQYLDSCIKSYNAGDKEMWNEIVNYYLHYEDKENVFLWSKRAAEEGCVSAYCTLGWAYRNKGDTENAAFWFEKTLESDVDVDEYAKFNLISHYADIRPQRAIELYESYDDCKAYEIDGSFLRSFGDRLTKKGNYELAFYWYSKAVEKGNRIAKDKIAEFYENGYYVEKDVNKAIEMYKENDTFISRFALERLNVK